jgi:hypothetical protein
LNLEVAITEDIQKTSTEPVNGKTVTTNPSTEESAMVSETETETADKNIELVSSKAKAID